ncbi:nucleolar protein [Collariella sp. IMI 366227]|nr:nucleolar protein [Collariella sp. IMI 366227]
MAPELRKRKSKPALAEPEPAAKKAKATKTTPKAEKRKAPEDASPAVVKKQKPAKDAAPKKATPAEEKAAPKKSTVKKEKSAPKAKAAAEKPKKAAETEEQQESDIPSDVEEEEEVDADTKALVEALDSGDEEEEEKQISTYKKGQDVGKAPKPKKAAKSSSTGASSGKPGVMYLARIPHGFYEHELRSYFGQFGDITKLRVVRNKKTGASRHRAFIEFADAEVADIAARTMDKYLLFGHILTAKLVPSAQVHPDLFKGANRRFKVVPWNKMAGRQLERPLSESQWQVKITKEEKRRADRAEKLKDMGYEFEAPALKAAEAKPLLENGTEEEPKAIEAAPAAEEPEAMEVEKVEEPKEVKAKAKATKKTKETKPAAEKAVPQKGKKGKKTRS